LPVNAWTVLENANMASDKKPAWADPGTEAKPITASKDTTEKTAAPLLRGFVI